MIRKILATVAIAAVALIAAPAAANADETGYVGQGTDVTLTVGEVGTMTFSGLTASTPSTATADDLVTLAVVKASTASKPTDATGTVSYQVSSDTPGTYTITAVAGDSVATGTLTVVPADTAGGTGTGIADTGYDMPVLWLWIGGGALLLGAALIVVLNTVRRARNES